LFGLRLLYRRAGGWLVFTFSEGRRGVIAEEVAAAGQEIYDSKLKPLLEPESNGLFVAIEPTTGSYYVGSTIVGAIGKAELTSPNANFHIVRVGFPAGISFNHKVVV
jgi:hypothetical protein